MELQQKAIRINILKDKMEEKDLAAKKLKKLKLHKKNGRRIKRTLSKLKNQQNKLMKR